MRSAAATGIDRPPAPARPRAAGGKTPGPGLSGGLMHARLALLGTACCLLPCAGPGASRAMAHPCPGAKRRTGPMSDEEALRGIEALRRRDEAASKAYDVEA